MEKLYTIIPKKTLILIITLILVITGLLLILFLRQPKEKTLPPLPVVSLSPVPVNSLQKAVIGKTKPDDVEKKFEFKEKRVLTNGDLSYSISSKIDARPDLILFRNNSAQFERLVILGNEAAIDTEKLSVQIQKYGPAEKILEGSKFYGNHINTYIYASKGFTFVANPNTEEIYEIQTFPSTTVEDYLRSYGEDIIGEVKPIQEDFSGGSQ